MSDAINKRHKALAWWEPLDIEVKRYLINKYHNTVRLVTGREIESIYYKEQIPLIP